MEIKVGDLVRRRKSDCVGVNPVLVGLVLKIQPHGRYARMIHVLFGNRVRRYSECYGAHDLKVISANQR